jgi:putative hydrolase of HD superfamily
LTINRSDSPGGVGAHTDGDPFTPGSALALLLELDALKQVQRQNPLVGVNRPETTAEHSWSVVMAVHIFRSLASERIDSAHAFVLGAVHDIPEAFVGDTFVYGAEEAMRQGRESSSMKAFVARHAATGEVAQEIYAMWREVEERSTPEGRFVHALDVLLPVFVNASNPEGSSWRRHSVRASQVRRRIDQVRDIIPLLAELADEAVTRGVADGSLGDE